MAKIAFSHDEKKFSVAKVKIVQQSLDLCGGRVAGGMSTGCASGTVIGVVFYCIAG